ncbi:MAG: epoxyqueuosine reductase QueH [Oscillospiraceae bacterium]|nr:epoxyqueuosine reductase QueH [Oscillospiraceae bacterium]
MKLLLHICCAPCSLMCIETLRGEELNPEGYWFNPNIHPFTEYRARRNCLREYAQTIDLKLIERNDYALRPFIREVASDIEGRCTKCYDIRLGETARFAAENGYDAFTSSLFISPYQQHEAMRSIAEAAASRFGVKFLYRDFRPYFKEGQTRARENGFYMQKYCGCVFSEEERYVKAKKIIREADFSWPPEK